LLQKANIEHYFDAEKTESIVFICIGAIAIGAALTSGLYFKSKWTMGLAIPLITVGIIQIAVGLSVYRQADKQRTNAVYAYDLDPAFIRDSEVPRMKKVVTNFKYYRYAEWAFVLIGIGLVAFVSTQSSHSMWNGIGWGLAAQGLVLLVLDYFAEKRGNIYLANLINWLAR
jgi:hypothetical protein